MNLPSLTFRTVLWEVGGMIFSHQKNWGFYCWHAPFFSVPPSWFGEKIRDSTSIYGCWTKNNGKTPQIIHSNRVFHYKLSILGYPNFWKHPYVNFDVWIGWWFSSIWDQLIVETLEMMIDMYSWNGLTLWGLACGCCWGLWPDTPPKKRTLNAWNPCKMRKRNKNIRTWQLSFSASIFTFQVCIYIWRIFLNPQP